MKLIFAGTPEFAAVALNALHAAGHEIALVLTQPERPAGRGLQPAPSAVKRLAQKLGIAVQQPATLKDSAIAGDLAAFEAEAIIVAAYGLIVPRDVLSVPARGCINVHASLLPRWRGAAPIQRAILAGDSETGISIMQMDAGLDTGPVLLREALAISPEDTAQTLHERLAALGGRLIVRALAESPLPQPQDDTLATYASKIDKREARIDWKQTALVNERKVRAFDPAPGVSTTYRGAQLKIWRAQGVAAALLPAGTVCDASASGITVACGDGMGLKLTELQRAGGKRLTAAAFIAGNPVSAGERMGE